MVEAGDVAFLKHTVVTDMIATGLFGVLKEADFESLCLDGTRRSAREYRYCNLGQVPGDALVTTSAKNIETRTKYQKFLTKVVELFGAPATTNRNTFRNTTLRPFDDFGRDSSRDSGRDFNVEPFSQQSTFKLFQSAPRYGPLNHLLLQDDTVNLKVIHFLLHCKPYLTKHTFYHLCSSPLWETNRHTPATWAAVWRGFWASDNVQSNP